MNDDNLIQNSERSRGEVEEIRKKGGINSGKARKRKKTLRDMTNTLLEMKASNEQVDAMLEAFGIKDKDRRNLMALPVAIFAEEEPFNGLSISSENRSISQFKPCMVE